ncbi:MAG: hypothetical protein IKZ35_00970 [Clostridia bacterium]|nr:hypothetical protein [Clostridia bacterium]
MEKVRCCPVCQSLDLSVTGENNEKLYCNNCEYEYESFESLKVKIEKREKVFSFFVWVMIFALVTGTVALYVKISYGYNIIADTVVNFTSKYGINIEHILIGGISCFVLSFLLMMFLFEFRKRLGQLKRTRYFIYKKGFLVVGKDGELIQNS